MSMCDVVWLVCMLVVCVCDPVLISTKHTSGLMIDKVVHGTTYNHIVCIVHYLLQPIK